MEASRATRGRLSTVAAYLAAAGMSTVAAVLAMRLDKADLRVPFVYGGDSLFYAMVTKTIVQGGGGSYWSHPLLGAPGALEMYDFPAAESLHHLTLEVLSALSANWAVVFNLYFILGFPIITLCALAVFRRFGISFLSAILGSVLYAFLPSRLITGEAHLFVDTFYEVPLVILVALWVGEEAPPLLRDRGAGRRAGLDLRSPRSLAAIAICAITASTGLYYAFFGGCMVVAAGAWASIRRGSARNVIAGLALAFVVVVVLAANGLPSVIHRARHGATAEIAARSPSESEIYGLRITQLLLPTDGHRVPVLRRIKERYNAAAPFPGESSLTSLGVVASAGFLVLLEMLLVGLSRARPQHQLWQPLAALNLTAILLGTIGGFGSLFALLVTPQIRTYCRLNVFIAFLALFAVVLLLDHLRALRPKLALWVLPVVLLIGLFDQTTPLDVPPYRGIKRLYNSDAAMVGRIEQSVPPGSMIFELPNIGFPEAPRVGRLHSYDLVRPYLHSNTLRWSLSIRGSAADAWASAISRLPPPALLRELSSAGFAGILVDRYGYADNGAEIEGALGALLGTAPFIDAERRLAFFQLPSRGEVTERASPR